MSQKIISGLGSISKLINILENKEAKNILLVTGKESYLTSGAAEASESATRGHHRSRSASGGAGREAVVAAAAARCCT